MPGFQEITQLVVEKWELLLAVVVLLGATGISGALYKAWQTRRQQQRSRQIPSGDFPFEIIPPYSQNVLKQLMPDSRGDVDPLAEFNIPYQARQPDRNIRQELEQALVDRSWVLIMGRSGLGKTREAAHLVELLNGEGWTVLKLGEHLGWLDEPRQFPAVLNPTDKLLFFLDDLNRWCYRGNPREMPENANDPTQPLRVPVQERLLKTLKFFERECRSGNVRVIATARNETQPDHNAAINPIEMLQWEKYPELWQRFDCYELMEPSEQAVVNLLRDRVTATQLASQPEDFTKIARRNDGTFRNIIENLRKAQNRQLIVGMGEFSEHMNETWRQGYNTAIQRYPVAKLIYDAVELLLRLNLSLSPQIVAATANLLSPKRGIAAWRQKRQIDRALAYLRQAENILRPAEGQIEAKKTPSVSLDYASEILRLLTQVGNQYPQFILANEFSKGGLALNALGRRQDAIDFYDRAIQCKSDYYEVWNLRGIALDELGRYQEAIDSYGRAIQCKLGSHEAWFMRGFSWSKLGRYQEAIDSYDRAIQFKPDFHEAWFLRGVALFKLGRNQEVIDSFDKVIQFKLDDYGGWFLRGGALIALGLYQEAIDSYDRAIEYKPDYHEAWNIRGVALFNLGRNQEAIESYDRAIEFKPDYHTAWNNRGLALSDLGRKQEAIESYDKAIEFKPDDHIAWYNRGHVLDSLGRYEEALASFDRAVVLNHHFPWCGRGKVLMNLGRYEEALSSFAQAITLSPDDAESHYHQARCYALQGNFTDTITALLQAITLDPDYRELAQMEAEFDSIRQYPEFQAVVQNDER